MTGGELIEWVQENGAEGMQVVQVDDGYMLHAVRPEVRENAELRETYANTRGLRKDGRSIVLS